VAMRIAGIRGKPELRGPGVRIGTWYCRRESLARATEASVQNILPVEIIVIS
jgi:hypothetical protein